MERTTKMSSERLAECPLSDCLSMSHVEACLKSDADLSNKLQAIKELQTCVLKLLAQPLSNADLDNVIALTDIALSDGNFQILQGGLEVLESLVQAASGRLTPHMSAVVAIIVPKMGGKFVVRQSLTKISLLLMECVGPDAVISELMSCGFKSKASKIREDVINIIIAALLKFPRTDINLLEVAQRVSPCLVDSRQRVRQASLEAFAVLAHALGRGNVQPLVAVVSGVEWAYCQEVQQADSGLMAAFHTRLNRHQLPGLSADGLVEHAVQASPGLGSAGKGRSLIGDDVEWILQGSVSCNPHQGSPTGESASRVPSGVRTYHSANRTRLPWESADSSPQKSKKLASIPPKTKKSLPPTVVSLGGKRSSGNSYAEMHRTRLRMRNADQNQMRPMPMYPSSVVALSNNGGNQDSNHGGQPLSSGWLLSSLQGASEDNSSPYSGLSLTWPAPNPDPTAANTAGAVQSHRPSSKPRVRHPLSGVKAKSLSTSDAPEDGDARDSPEFGGDIPGRRVDTYDDDFEDIYDDDFEGNSLSSSISSLAVKELREASTRLQQEGKAQSPSLGKKANSEGPTEAQSCLAQRTLHKLEKERHKQKSTKARPELAREEGSKGPPAGSSRSHDEEPHSLPKRNDSFLVDWGSQAEPELRAGRNESSKSLSPDVSPSSQKKAVSLSKSAKGRLLGQKLRPLDPVETLVVARKPGAVSQPPPHSVQQCAENEPENLRGSEPGIAPPAPSTQGLVTPPSDTADTGSSLQPLPQPEQALKDTLQSLPSSNWEGKVVSMETIRRVALHHSDLMLSHLNSVMLAITTEVKNLRSAVSKAAIECLSDVFLSLGPAVEPQLEPVVKVLLHRAGTANSFLREACEAALRSMVLSVQPHRALLALASGGASHKNAIIRRTATQFIFEGVARVGGAGFLESPKEVLEVVSPLFAKLLSDSSPEARYYCRRILNELYLCPGFDKVMSRVLSPQLQQQLDKAVELLKKKGVGDYPMDVHSARARSTARPHSGSASAGTGDKRARHISQQATPTAASGRAPTKRSGRQRSLSSVQGSTVPGPALSSVLEQLTSSDWSQRLQAVSQLEELVQVSPMAVIPFAVKMLDSFVPRLADPNHKVNLQALQAFASMVPLLGNHMSSAAWSILSSLPITSKLGGVASAACGALDLICLHLEPQHLLQPLANLAEFTNTKSQVIFIHKINELLPHLYHTSPTRVHQQVLPLLWRLLETKSRTNPELGPAVRSLCSALHQQMGKTLLDKASSLPQETLVHLQEFLST